MYSSMYTAKTWRYGYEPFERVKCNSEELRGAIKDYADPPPPPMYVN